MSGETSNNPAGAELDYPPVLGWLHEASNPYWDWFWGSPEVARRQAEAWMNRPSSEWSPTRALWVEHEGRRAGGMISMPGDELMTCRKADLMALIGHLREHPDAALTERMRQARSLFLPVPEDEYYLSRLGVEPFARGYRLGRVLFELGMEDGRRRGYRNFRLDVCAQNEPGLRIYRMMGFTLVNEAHIPGTPVHYYAMKLTL